MMRGEGLDSDIFYHYTSVTAAISIIDSGCLWLTHYQDLKDNKELIRGYEIVEKALLERFFNMPHAKFLFDVKKHLPKDYYILCLSPYSDNEHLWKEYADSGKGVAIGFDAQTLLQISSKEVGQTPFGFEPVLYDSAVYKRQVKQNLLKIHEPVFSIINLQYVVQKKSTKYIPNFVQLRDCMSRCLANGMLLKGQRYAIEKEWRLVHCPEYGNDKSAFEYTRKLGKRRAIIHCSNLPIVNIKFRKIKKKARKQLLDKLVKCGYNPDLTMNV